MQEYYSPFIAGLFESNGNTGCQVHCQYRIIKDNLYYCAQLMDTFAVVIQGLMALLALSTLLRTNMQTYSLQSIPTPFLQTNYSQKTQGNPEKTVQSLDV